MTTRRLVITAAALAVAVLIVLSVRLPLDTADKVMGIIGAIVGMIAITRGAGAVAGPVPQDDPVAAQRAERRRVATLSAVCGVLAVAVGVVSVMPVPPRPPDKSTDGGTAQPGAPGPSGETGPPGATGPSGQDGGTDERGGRGGRGGVSDDGVRDDGSGGRGDTPSPTVDPTAPSTIDPPTNDPPTTDPPTVDPPTTDPPTGEPPAGQPWEPPSDARAMTLEHTDAVTFGSPSTQEKGTGWGDLTFQADTHQINWWNWTDTTDLSLAGCRSTAADHWDSVRMSMVRVPETLCRVDPDNAGRVEYLQIVEQDMTEGAEYVKVRAWVVTG